MRNFVLMAHVLAIEEYVLSDEPRALGIRESLGEDTVRPILEQYRWIDPIHSIRRAAPAALLVQLAREDPWAPLAIARCAFEAASQPKTLKTYEGGHALPPAARLDRSVWLQQRLGLQEIDAQALAAIPPLR